MNLFYQSPAVAQRLLKEFGYTCVDYSCAFPFEQMARDELCAIRDLTKSLGLVPFALHLPPGRGTVDWKAVHAALGDAGYTGPVTFELNLTDTIENVLSESIAYWRGLSSAVA